jgi:acyl-CoA thioesterase-1
LVILAAIVHAFAAFWHPGTAMAQSAPLTIVAYGDSLTAGYGLPPKAAFPVQLQAALKAKGHDVEVVNAGVSGDTTAAALERFDWAVPDTARAAIVELGANDGLRGLSVESTRTNLQAVIDRTRVRWPAARIVLAGMRLPENLGPDYTGRFVAMYPALASTNGVELIPFLLEGVAGIAELNQADQIHPNAEGHRRVATNVWKRVAPILREGLTGEGTNGPPKAVLPRPVPAP